MTTHATGRHNRQDAGRYINRIHIVTGTATEVANILANHRNAGTLIDLTQPFPVGDLVQVTIRLREFQPTTRVASVGEYARTRVQRRTRRTRTAVIVTTITGTIAGAAAVAAYLIGQLVEFIAAHAAQLLGVLVLAAVIAAAAARRSSTNRRHCPGC